MEGNPKFIETDFRGNIDKFPVKRIFVVQNLYVGVTKNFLFRRGIFKREKVNHTPPLILDKVFHCRGKT